MRFKSDWREILRKAWSVRFNLFNAVCVGLGSGIFGLTMDWPPHWVAAFVIACVLFQLAPILARILWQADFHPKDDD